MQFVDSKGNGTGTMYNFTIPSGSSSITLPGFNVGTVAGTIAIAITTDGIAQQTGVVVVPLKTPVIDSGSVQFTNITSTSFDLEFVGTSDTRSLAIATVILNPAPGDQIVGQQEFDVDVTDKMNAWFSSTAGLQFGGRFSLTLPFQLSGDVKAISSATVTVRATTGGIASAAVTGNR
jgi:hypothetical protein